MFFELVSSDKMYVTRLNLHEIKSDILLDYTGDFELNGTAIIGTAQHKTKIRFRFMGIFESYLDAINVDYDSEDVIFTAYVFELNSLQFKFVERSAYAKGTNYLKEVVEYPG